MKRTLSISLLILMLANVAGFYVYFIFRLREIKLEMRAALKDFPEEKLQRLVMTAQQYEQAQNDEGEVKWEGFMYDVARVIPQDNQRIVLALRDEGETSLLAFLNKVVETSGHDDKTPPGVLTQFLSLVFTLPDSLNFSNGVDVELKKYSPLIGVRLSSIIPDVIAPPPRGYV
jgi:hypothetical protein